MFQLNPTRQSRNPDSRKVFPYFSAFSMAVFYAFLLFLSAVAALNRIFCICLIIELLEHVFGLNEI